MKIVTPYDAVQQGAVQPETMQVPAFAVATLEPFYRGKGKPTEYTADVKPNVVYRFSVRTEADGTIHLRAYSDLAGVDICTRKEDAYALGQSLIAQAENQDADSTPHQSANFGEGILVTLPDLENALGEVPLEALTPKTQLFEGADLDRARKALGIDPASVQMRTIGDEDNETEARVETYDVDYETRNYPYPTAHEDDRTDAVPYQTAGRTQTGIPVQEAETPSEPKESIEALFSLWDTGFQAGKMLARLEDEKGVEHRETKNYLNIADPFDAGFEAGYAMVVQGPGALLALAAKQAE